MKNDCSPLSVLKKALRQWFTEMLSEAVDRLTDFEVDFFTESQLQNHPPFEFDTDRGIMYCFFSWARPTLKIFPSAKRLSDMKRNFPVWGRRFFVKSMTPLLLTSGLRNTSSMSSATTAGTDTAATRSIWKRSAPLRKRKSAKVFWRCTATKYGLRGMTSGTISNHGCLPPTRLHIRALCPRSCKRYSICRRGNTATSHILPTRLCCPASSSGTAK